MSFVAEGESSNMQTAEELLGATVGNTTPIESYSAGQSIGTIEVDQLPEEYKGETPTVKIVQLKVEKKTLPPEYKTKNLPPKEVTNKHKPLFPPGTEPFEIPNV